jgi:hypothetical protein
MSRTKIQSARLSFQSFELGPLTPPPHHPSLERECSSSTIGIQEGRHTRGGTQSDEGTDTLVHTSFFLTPLFFGAYFNIQYQIQCMPEL